MLLVDALVPAISCAVASVAKTFSWSWPSRVEVHRWQSPCSIPPCPWWIHHRQGPPWTRHWWPDREVRRRMMLPLTVIPSFWILPWWSPRPLSGWAPCCRCVGLTHENQTIRFGILNGLVFTLPDAGPTFDCWIHQSAVSYVYICSMT
jgi:hypothetical protein